MAPRDPCRNTHPTLNFQRLLDTIPDQNKLLHTSDIFGGPAGELSWLTSEKLPGASIYGKTAVPNLRVKIMQEQIRRKGERSNTQTGTEVIDFTHPVDYFLKR